LPQTPGGVSRGGTPPILSTTGGALFIFQTGPVFQPSFPLLPAFFPKRPNRGAPFFPQAGGCPGVGPGAAQPPVSRPPPAFEDCWRDFFGAPATPPLGPACAPCAFSPTSASQWPPHADIQAEETGDQTPPSKHSRPEAEKPCPTKNREPLLPRACLFASSMPFDEPSMRNRPRKLLELSFPPHFRDRRPGENESRRGGGLRPKNRPPARPARYCAPRNQQRSASAGAFGRKKRAGRSRRSFSPLPPVSPLGWGSPAPL